MQLKSIAALGLLLLTLTGALRILVVFPMAMKSHSILGHGVVNRLLEYGHEVVHLTTTPRDQPEKNLKEIIAPDVLSKLIKDDPDSFNALSLKNVFETPNHGDSVFFFNFTYNYHKIFLEDKRIMDFLSDRKEKFDAVVVEWLFFDMIAGIAPLFQCPLIWLGSTEAHWQIIRLVDNIPSPALNVDMFSTKPSPLDFWDRFWALWMMFKKLFIMNHRFYPKEKELYNSYFTTIADKREVTMPTYEEAVYNGSLLLLNSHPTIGTPFSLPQSAKYVGGYHIDFKAKPLPPDLQNLMDFARHGVIYFSMGSNLRSSDMSKEMINSLVKILASFKQRIIWKFEGELKNKPPNVFLVKWAPQQSILAHPTLKLFITHGGQLSTTEAIHYGVPVIGIPVIADQHLNMAAVVRKRFGLKVNINGENFAYDLGLAIKKILVNPRFKQRAKELSEAYHDRPVSPRKELVHWVEHVVKTRGAPHLRSQALMVPGYRIMYLDLIFIALTILYVIMFILHKIEQTYKTVKRIRNVKHRKTLLNKTD